MKVTKVTNNQKLKHQDRWKNSNYKAAM